jgi:putative sporulation protein YtxC
VTVVAQLVLAVKHAFPELCRRLEERAFFFNKEGYSVNISKMTIDGWPHLFFAVQGQDGAASAQAAPFFRQQLAEALADYILEGAVPSYLEEMLDRQYFYFPNHERREIINLSEKVWQKEREEEQSLRPGVSCRLKEMLERQDYLNIHGLVMFRLPEWRAALRRCLDQAVDDFLMEKEYQEFIKLLKYFVQLQEPKVYQVHVALDQQGNLVLLDQNYNYIEGPKQGADWEETAGDKDDLLISTLITAAPQKIVLHRQVHVQYPRATDTLKHVFEKRVSLCRRCKICHETGGIITLKGKH